MSWKLINGNNIDILKEYEDNTFDSIVTDPPYGIEFLGKDWDSNTGAVETWEECFRVLKPGGHILAFSAARTYHNLATNIESVGFDIRDQLMWLYGSGFPKAQDIGKAIDKRANKGKEQTPEGQQWAGWKTALKPAHEPIVMARKPFKGPCVDNVLKHSTGALNIDESRVPFGSEDNDGRKLDKYGDASGYSAVLPMNAQGRFPSNVLGEVEDYQKYFYCPKVSRAERHAGFEQTKGNLDHIPNTRQMLDQMGGYYCDQDGNKNPPALMANLAYVPGKGVIQAHGVTNAYEKFIQAKGNLDHIPKTKGGMLEQTIISSENKHCPGQMYSIGKNMKPTVQAKGNLDHIPKNNGGMLDGTDSRYIDRSTDKGVGNNHPTVKPIALMKYLVKLVTPPGGTVLDPFNGSGSTGMACVELGFDYIGCELDPDYIDIATRRIGAWESKFKGPKYDLFE